MLCCSALHFADGEVSPNELDLYTMTMKDHWMIVELVDMMFDFVRLVDVGSYGTWGVLGFAFRKCIIVG